MTTTIRKTSDRASKLLDQARDIRCFSLSNSFNGTPLPEKPLIVGEPRPGEHHRPLVNVSPTGFLRHELNKEKSTKLVDSGNGHYTIHVHSNLWFTFLSGIFLPTQTL